MSGNPLPCYIKSRAMVNGGANEREAQVGRDAFFKPVDLYRYVSLIVEHSQNHVVATFDGVMEDNIRRYGADSVDALVLSFGHCRSDFLGLFTSQ